MSTNNQSLKIVVAEASIIIRSGVSAVLKRIPNLDIHPIEVNSVEALSHYAHLHQPDMVIINPSFDGWFNLPAFKAEHPRLTGVKYIALISSVTHNNVLKEYDERFSICDDLDIIAAKLNGLLRGDEEEEEEKDNENRDLRCEGHDEQSYCRQALPEHPHRHHPPPQHRAQAADTLARRPHHLRHRQQAGGVERHQGETLKVFLHHKLRRLIQISIIACINLR